MDDLPPVLTLLHHLEEAAATHPSTALEDAISVTQQRVAAIQLDGPFDNARHHMLAHFGIGSRADLAALRLALQPVSTLPAVQVFQDAFMGDLLAAVDARFPMGMAARTAVANIRRDRVKMPGDAAAGRRGRGRGGRGGGRAGGGLATNQNFDRDDTLPPDQPAPAAGARWARARITRSLARLWA